MDRLELDGAFLDYEITGAGEQVALLHARPFVSWYEPLVAALSGCAVLRYRRGVPTAASAPAFGIDEDPASAPACSGTSGSTGHTWSATPTAASSPWRSLVTAP